jgi:hypothetical protein
MFIVMHFLWPLTLLFLGILVWGLLSTSRHERNRTWGFLSGCLPIFVSPFAILLYGAVFTGVDTAIVKLGFPALLLFQLVVGCYLLRKWPDASRAVIVSVLFAGYMAVIASYIGCLSVTDNLEISRSGNTLFPIHFSEGQQRQRGKGPGFDSPILLIKATSGSASSLLTYGSCCRSDGLHNLGGTVAALRGSPGAPV